MCEAGDTELFARFYDSIPAVADFNDDLGWFRNANQPQQAFYPARRLIS
jgi:hypothetical protein